MKLASKKSNSKDGSLIVVSIDNSRYLEAPTDFTSLIKAIESWDDALKVLNELSIKVNKGEGKSLENIELLAPLPRTYSWLDGSAFIQHVILVRKARGAEPPEDLYDVPLMYQGVSDNLLSCNSDIEVADEAYGIDFEGEIAVVVDDVPMGVTAEQATKHIKLLLLMNDVSLRNLIPRELATGFGFFHGKPASSFAPFAVTPDELSNSWKDSRLHLPLYSWLNGLEYGKPNASEMYFSFADLISHAAKTRHLSAGTIIGSGTISNKDESVGSSCLAEKRMLEKINSGSINTPFMKFGDRIEMEVFDERGHSVFGRINQIVKKYGAK
jgi:fumarylacetoacetate (FAA) hydrolase